MGRLSKRSVKREVKNYSKFLRIFSAFIFHLESDLRSLGSTLNFGNRK